MKRMISEAKQMKRPGGKSMAKLLEKWKNSCCTISSPHTTVTPTKRKLENDLKEETVKRQKLESDVATLKKEMDEHKAEDHELRREIYRSKEPKKKKQGSRGKTTRNLSYKRAQKHRHKAQSINKIKETVAGLHCRALRPALKTKDSWWKEYILYAIGMIIFQELFSLLTFSTGHLLTIL